METSESTPWTVRLPADATAPGVARAVLDEWLIDVAPEVRRDARSVASEIVANALREGRPPIELSVQTRDGRVRIEVADGGMRTRRRPPEAWAQWIVARLAARWGVRGDDAHVWFELPLGGDDTASRLSGQAPWRPRPTVRRRSARRPPGPVRRVA